MQILDDGDQFGLIRLLSTDLSQLSSYFFKCYKLASEMINRKIYTRVAWQAQIVDVIIKKIDLDYDKLFRRGDSVVVNNNKLFLSQIWDWLLDSISVLGLYPFWVGACLIGKFQRVKCL